MIQQKLYIYLFIKINLIQQLIFNFWREREGGGNSSLTTCQIMMSIKLSELHLDLCKCKSETLIIINSVSQHVKTFNCHLQFYIFFREVNISI